MGSLLASLVAGVAGAGFVISISCDIGYFHELGYPIQELPTTFSDHVRSAVNWISWILMSSIIAIAIWLFTTGIEKGQTEEEIINTSPVPRFFRKFRSGWVYFLTAVVLLAFVSYLLWGVLTGGAAVGIFIIWLEFSIWCFTTQCSGFYSCNHPGCILWGAFRCMLRCYL